MSGMAAWQHGSYASTAAMPAWQLCQHSSYSSTAAMPARQLCQHGSYASTVAMPARQLCQHGSYVSTAALLLWLLFTLYDWLTTMTTNDNKTTKNMVLWVANALTAQLKTGLLQTPTCLSRPGLTLFLPDLVMWRLYKGWFRPWPVGIGLSNKHVNLSAT